MVKQAYEVDFFAVGNGQRSGDAIAMRFGFPGDYKVMVYDGGTKDSGKAIVEHVKKHYGTTRADFVVNSHPDGDHASGLSVVLEELEVGELWMHQPWHYSEEIRDYFHDGRMTDASLAERLKDKMAAAHALEAIAIKKNVPIRKPFQGAVIGGIFRILSPGEDWYKHELIQEFAKSPEQKKASLVSEAYDFVKAAVESIVDWVKEEWGSESLRDDVTTSAENESSVVLFGQIEEYGVLLTGDAGVRALTEVGEYAERIGLNLPTQITFAQVPHHGSRNNVSTTVMNRIFGLPLLDETDDHTRIAFVSAAKESESHPKPAVVNAFIRRGFGVYHTKGTTIFHRRGMPDRENWGPIKKLIFAKEVQAW
jgi:beta-lactamase superfamily II metal-dependent hydrolase